MTSYPQAPENGKPDEGTIRSLIRVINNIMRGKTNNRGTVTLTAGSATTVVNDINAGGDSVILLQPTTANAAAALANVRVTANGKQTFTLTHANNAQTDRIFKYVIIG